MWNRKNHQDKYLNPSTTGIREAPHRCVRISWRGDEAWEWDNEKGKGWVLANWQEEQMGSLS